MAAEVTDFEEKGFGAKSCIGFTPINHRRRTNEKIDIDS